MCIAGFQGGAGFPAGISAYRGDVLPKFVGLMTLCTRERHIAMGARSPETQFGTCLNTPHLPYS